VEISERRIWLDGELVPWERANVHVLSQSVQRGSLVFDVMSVHWLADGAAIFGLRAHARRFINSAQLSGMTLPLGLDGVLTAIGETLRANPGAEVVKISAYYPGISLDVLPRESVATIAIAAFAVGDLYPGARSGTPQKPAELRIADPRKMPSWVMSPQAKLAAGYLYTAVAKAEARKKGYDDILLLDENGDIAESSTQSFCIVDGGAVYTAPVDTVLRGITRKVVLELARDEGIIAHETRLPRAQLARAEEAFVCGTTIHVWAVSRIDEIKFAQPVPGPVTTRLAERLAKLLEGRDPVFSPKYMQKV
jgi:branched-chain amino acid aminotransferase